MFFKQKKHTYVVFYRYTDGQAPTQTWGFGNCDAQLIGTDFFSMEKIRKLEKELEENYKLNTVVITGWKEIEV